MSSALFQNRYKSIVVEDEPYLLELTRYIHLNPLRAGVIKTPAALDRYPWTGHSALLATVPRPWQATDTILIQFGRTAPRTRRAYRAFVAAGIPQGRRPDLQGGGLLRSVRGWTAVTALRRGREVYANDERVLGSSAFVDALQRDAAAREEVPPRAPALAVLGARVCAAVGLTPAQLAGGGRTPAAVAARAGVAYLWVEVLGHPGRPLAPYLGVQPAAIPKAARRGAATAGRWRQLLTELQES